MPTNHFQSFLRARGWLAISHPELLIFLSISAAVVAKFCLDIFSELEIRPVKRSSTARTAGKVAPTSRWILGFKVGVTLFLIGQNMVQINDPLDFDERSIAYLFLHSTFANIANPFRRPENHTENTNQSIATVASYASVKLFGPGKVPLRLPCEIVTVLFLGLLFYFSRRLSKLTTVILYSHLAANGLITFYLHVAKGYIYMMSSSLILFFLATQGKMERRDLALFTVALWVTIFSHTFGALFAAVLIFSLAVHAWFNRSEMSTAELRSRVQMFLISAAHLPLVAGVVAFHYYSMWKRNEIGVDAHETYWDSWGGLLGGSHSAVSKSLAVLGVWILVSRARDWEKLKTDFPTFFVVSSTVFFGAVMLFLSTSHPYPRVLLAFLVPFVVWFASSAEAIPSFFHRKIALIGVLFFLILSPFIYHGIAQCSEKWENADLDIFVDETRRISGGQTECFVYHGEGFARELVEKFYFGRPRPVKAHCKTFYHLILADNIPPVRHSFRGTVPADWQELYVGVRGRALYSSKPTRLTTSVPH